MNRRVLLLTSLALLAGCAAAPPVVEPGAPSPELEPVFSAVAGREALTIEVESSGCTVKGDFAFYLERTGGAVTLSLARKRLDHCRSFARGKTALSFTWAELGVPPRKRVLILNPIVAWTGP